MRVALCYGPHATWWIIDIYTELGPPGSKLLRDNVKGTMLRGVSLKWPQTRSRKISVLKTFLFELREIRVLTRPFGISSAWLSAKEYGNMRPYNQCKIINTLRYKLYGNAKHKNSAVVDRVLFSLRSGISALGIISQLVIIHAHQVGTGTLSHTREGSVHIWLWICYILLLRHF